MKRRIPFTNNLKLVLLLILYELLFPKISIISSINSKLLQNIQSLYSTNEFLLQRSNRQIEPGGPPIPISDSTNKNAKHKIHSTSPIFELDLSRPTFLNLIIENDDPDKIDLKFFKEPPDGFEIDQGERVVRFSPPEDRSDFDSDSKIERFIDLLENFAVELVSRSGNDLVPIFAGCGILGSEIFFF